MASAIYSGAFDIAAYGSLAIDWTDASGAHNGVVTMSSGTYFHGTTGTSLSGVTGGAAIAAAYPSFIAALVALMDAATAQTVTGSFSETTGLFTLACTGGTFTLSFPGAPGARMQALLGFNGAITGLTSYTGSHHPYYVIKPYLPCVSGYDPPAKESGRSITKRAADGSLYTLKPTTIVQVSQWRHDFEPKGMIDRAYFNLPSGDSALNKYTWEDLWSDYGSHRHPIGAIWVGSSGTTERTAFDLMVDDFDKTTHRRMSPRDDLRFAVMIAASIRARAFA